AMPMAHLAGEPARIGGAPAKRAGDLLGKGADLRRLRHGRVEMVKRRSGSRFRRGGGEPALMLGEGVGVERILPRQVLRMDKGLGAGDAHPELRPRLSRAALAVISVTGRGEIGLRELRSLRPLAPGDARAETHAIGAGGRAEYARDARAPKTGERIVAGAFFKRGDGADRGREQRDLAWEHVAEQAGNAQRHVDPRPPQHRERQNFEAADAGGRRIPDRTAAEEREGLREIVAAGAHGRRAPEVEHDALRPFAVVLRVALEDFVGGAAADLPGVAGRGRTRIDGVEIAAGRQNVEPATRGRAGRPGRNKASAKRAQEAKQFGGAACGYALGQSFFLRLLSDRSGGKEALGALRRAAEYVEAVADAHVLQVAEPGVEGDQGLIGRLAVGGAFLDEAALFSPLENERRNDPRAARIKRLRLGELVEQA